MEFVNLEEAAAILPTMLEDVFIVTSDVGILHAVYPHGMKEESDAIWPAV